jgi:hypothetical protein
VLYTRNRERKKRERNKQENDKARPAHSPGPQRPTTQQTKRRTHTHHERVVAVVLVDHENKKTNYVSRAVVFILFYFSLHWPATALSLSFFFAFCQVSWPDCGSIYVWSLAGLGRPGLLLLWLSRLYTNQNTRARQTDSSQQLLPWSNGRIAQEGG